MAYALFAPSSVPFFTHRLADNQTLRFGRDPACEVFLPDAWVSRIHARIEAYADHFILRDDSRNGTKVNGKAIREHSLRPGDWIELGPYRFQFRQLEDPSDTTPTRGGATEPLTDFPFVGTSPCFRETIRLCHRAARSAFPVLLLGETGTGKEVLARTIHQAGPRRDRPFLALNCGAFNRSLLESELFGHERGAFTGAHQRRLGHLENASEGTLFLDEIGELPIDMQPALLRVLEDRSFRRIGSSEELRSSARIVAATNRSLDRDMETGRFREDLFHRLEIFVIRVPPLRERPEDLPILAKDLLAQAGLSQFCLDRSALARLRAYDFPGNIRELRNLLIRSASWSDRPELKAEDLLFRQAGAQDSRQPESDGRSLDQLEQEIIAARLRRFSGNRVRAAQSLGIARSTLADRIRKYEPRDS